MDTNQMEEIFKIIREQRQKKFDVAKQQLGYDPVIKLDNGKNISLNPIMLLKQHISKKQFVKLENLYKKKYFIFDEIKNMSNDEVLHIRFLAETLTKLEFDIQHAWGFERDIKYHRFWEIPKCSCPKMDNDDSWPTGYYFTATDCILHGNKSKSKE